MSEWREPEIWIVALLLGVILLLWLGFSEVFERLRPRVLYVHSGRDTADDDAESSGLLHAAEG